MNLDNAIAAHAEWKIKLRTAAASGERLDVRTIGADDCCELGRWLHGDAKRLLGHKPLYAECVEKHAGFHREAAKVAEAVNAGQGPRAAAMLESGTDYATASSAVGVVLTRLKRELSAA